MPPTFSPAAPPTGARVVIYDWMGTGPGPDCREAGGRGCHVRLAVNHHCACRHDPDLYAFRAVARLHKLGVEVIPGSAFMAAMAAPPISSTRRRAKPW